MVESLNGPILAKEYRQKLVALDEKRKTSSPTKSKVQLTSTLRRT